MKFWIDANQVEFFDEDGNVTDRRPATPLERGLYEVVAAQREELEQLKETLTEQENELDRLTGLVAQLNRVIDLQNGPLSLSPNTF